MLLFSLENFEINITISNAIFYSYRAFKLIDITGNAHVNYMIHIEKLISFIIKSILYYQILYHRTDTRMIKN